MNLGPGTPLTISLIKEAQGERLSFDVLDLTFLSRIHQDYEIKVTVLSSDQSRDVFKAGTERTLGIGQWYWVEIHFLNTKRLMLLQGLCTAFTATGRYDNDQELQQLTLRSALYPLFTNQRTGIYYGGSLTDVIQKGLVALCRQHQFHRYTDFELKLSASPSLAYPAQLSLTQYFEADMAFILRQMREFGAWFNFYPALNLPDHLDAALLKSKKVTAMLGDHNSAFNRHPGKLAILAQGESQGAGLYQVSVHTGKSALGRVIGIFYDEISGRTLEAEASVLEGQPYRCLKYTVPQTALTKEQLQYQTQVVADSLSLRQNWLEAQFQDLPLQAGEVIELDDNQLQLSGDYLLYEVHYQFSKANSAEDPLIYRQNHSLKAYPLKLPYREAVLDDSGRAPELYRAPRYQGVMPGIFALTEGEHTVTPSSQGSIPLWFPYNYWYRGKNARACRYTRIIAPANQGGKAGVSFPYYQDTEFILMFADGHLDRPMIKGTAANNLSGHLHRENIQQRSALALPQGQHLLYSNVPGDQNFLKFGATHGEYRHETHMLLSNYQDPARPGIKKLDYQQASTKSYERVTGGNFFSQLGGMLRIRTQTAKLPPKVYLVLQLGDQTNIEQPTQKPILTEYLSNLHAEISAIHPDNLAGNPKGVLYSADPQRLQIKIKLADSLEDPKLPALKSIKIRLTHNTHSGRATEAVNIIYVNQHPLLPDAYLELKPSLWQQHTSTDAEGNLIYTVYVQLLAPPLLLNFRAGEWGDEAAMAPAAAKHYGALKKYFACAPATPGTKATGGKALLSPDMIAFFKAMGANVTLFIHGFNVDWGQYPVNYVPDTTPLLFPVGGQTTGAPFSEGCFTLHRDKNFLETKFPQAYAGGFFKNDDTLYGTGAHLWLLNMEYNLNQAAGFDGKDFKNYTRLIGIAWEGNPASALDYMAATAMTEFPAQKLVQLIQALHRHGLKINLMAHSLGNAVLLRTLNLCAEQGLQIEHAFLWEPAVPNNCLDKSPHDYFPMYTLDDHGEEVPLDYAYHYPHAGQGAKTFTVLYSARDTILGNIDAKPTQTTWTAEAIHDFFCSLVHPNYVDTAFHTLSAIGRTVTQALASEILFNPGIYVKKTAHTASPKPTPDLAGEIFYETAQDPAAGFTFAVIAEVMFILDQFALPSLGQQTSLISIYHIANLFTEPFSYFFAGLDNIVQYYQDWQSHYQHYLLPGPGGGSQSTRFAPNLDAQMQILKPAVPDAFNLLSVGFSLAEALLHLHEVNKDKLVEFIENFYPLTRWINNAAPYFEADNPFAHYMATVVLSVLLTDQTKVAPAMGFTGITKDCKSYELVNLGKIIQSGQKDPEGKDLCTDHSAMLFPTREFREFIYKGVLMSGQSISFKKFGKWPI